MLVERLAPEADMEVPAGEAKRLSRMDLRSLGKKGPLAVADRRAQGHRWGSEGLLMLDPLGPLSHIEAGG